MIDHFYNLDALCIGAALSASGGGEIDQRVLGEGRKRKVEKREKQGQHLKVACRTKITELT